MKLKKHMAVPLGLTLFLAASTSLAQGVSISESVSNPTVCQWLTRNGNKLYLCGASSDVEAMVKEARYYQKPAIPIIDTAELNQQVSPLGANQKALSSAEAAPVRVASNIKPDIQKSIRTNSMLPASIASNLSQLKAVVVKKAGSRGFMVQSIGRVNDIKPKLVAVSDNDFQILKRRNRISLGVYSQYKNALRRQKKLAALGIQSELIDRSLETTVQAPPLKKKVVNPIEPKKNRVEKRSPSNSKGFLVASVDSAKTTLSLLQVAKDKHFQVLQSAPYTNRVSLGVYNIRRFALIRQKEMLNHGIASIIVNRAERSDKRYVNRAKLTENALPQKVLPQKKVVVQKAKTPKRQVLQKKVEETVQAEIIVNQMANSVPNQAQLDRVIQLISSN